MLCSCLKATRSLRVRLNTTEAAFFGSRDFGLDDIFFRDGLRFDIVNPT